MATAKKYHYEKSSKSILWLYKLFYTLQYKNVLNRVIQQSTKANFCLRTDMYNYEIWPNSKSTSKYHN